MNTKETKLFEKIDNDKNGTLALLTLNTIPTFKGRKGKEFIQKYGKGGVYIAFLLDDIKGFNKSTLLYKGLFEKDYINKCLYIGSSVNFLSRIADGRAKSMNGHPHAIARYLNDMDNLSASDISILFIPLPGESQSEIADKYEIPLQDLNEIRIGSRFLIKEYSSSNGENGTKQSSILQQISEADQELVDTILTAAFKRNSTLKTMELLQN